MTEIPEHLLKRSRERRAAIGQGDEAASDTPAASSTPATTTPAATPAAAAPSGPAPRKGGTPAVETAPPPKPDPVHIAAAKRRKKIPFWAMATLSLMPVWAFLYVRAVTESPEVVAGPLGVGAEVFGNCASCHGATGGGGAGYAFNEGSVEATFPHIEDQIRYVVYGTEGYNAAGVEIYGNPDREGGPHITGEKGLMPAWGGQLTQAEIIGVVCHERYTLGGADPTSEEYATEFETWCAEESPVFAAVESGEYDFTTPEGETFGDVTVMPVGPEAVPGSAG